MLLAWLLLATSAPPEASGWDPSSMACDGGTQIFFEPGSDKIDKQATQRLEVYVLQSQNDDHDASIRIESGGDGYMSSFNSDLSRRRSEALRAYLIERGTRADRVRIFVQEEFGREQPVSGETAAMYSRVGWIAWLITKEEARRSYPPNMVTECF